jgi:hypothetical protein
VTKTEPNSIWRTTNPSHPISRTTKSPILQSAKDRLQPRSKRRPRRVELSLEHCILQRISINSSLPLRVRLVVLISNLRTEWETGNLSNNSSPRHASAWLAEATPALQTSRQVARLCVQEQQEPTSNSQLRIKARRATLVGTFNSRCNTKPSFPTARASIRATSFVPRVASNRLKHLR